MVTLFNVYKKVFIVMNNVIKIIDSLIKEFYSHQNNDYIGGNGSEHDYGINGVYDPFNSGYDGIDVNNYYNNEIDANKDRNSIADIVEEQEEKIYGEITDVVGSWGKDYNMNGDEIHGGYTVMNTNPSLNAFNNDFKYQDNEMSDIYNGINNQTDSQLSNQDNYNNYNPKSDLFEIIDEEIEYGYSRGFNIDRYDYDGIDLDANTEKIYNSHNNQNNDDNFNLKS